MSYENPIYATYTLRAASLASLGVLSRILGPAGKAGRVVGISTVVTTGVTVAASSVEVGIEGGDTDAYAVTSVPVSSAAASLNTGTFNIAEIPADTEIAIYTDGGCTAGAADIDVIIAWY